MKSPSKNWRITQLLLLQRDKLHASLPSKQNLVNDIQQEKHGGAISAWNSRKTEKKQAERKKGWRPILYQLIYHITICCSIVVWSICYLLFDSSFQQEKTTIKNLILIYNSRSKKAICCKKLVNKIERRKTYDDGYRWLIYMLHQ